MTDWYERRSDLMGGMMFRCHDGSLVLLDRRVPGDGSQWYVADWWGNSWAYMDSTIEPGDLAVRLPDTFTPAAA